MLEDIDRRLWAWGDYMRERWDAGLGYPRANTIHRCMREGPGAGQRGGRGEDPMPEAVEETECAVQRMPDALKAAVWCRYLRQEIDLHGAKRVGVSVKTYRTRIECAHHFLAGALQQTSAA